MQAAWPLRLQHFEIASLTSLGAYERTMNRALATSTGILLILTTALMVLYEWGAAHLVGGVLPLVTGVVILLLTIQVPNGRKIFVAVGLVLTLALAMHLPDWQMVVKNGLMKAAFICAFFCALVTLRSAAQGSPSIQKAGYFLAEQPPGRRYLALSFGGQLFALVLNYGAIALLGGLAVASAKTEPNPEIKEHRTRRMLLAIQRGFTSTLPWSPLSFAVAISTALIPGASWGKVLVPSLITSVLMVGTGWALDTIFKPKIAGPRPVRARPEGSWLLMAPLAILLAVIIASIGVLFLLTGIRVVGLVLVIVPCVSVVWVMLQTRGAEPHGMGGGMSQRLSDFAFTELPSLRGEIILLMMAGYIGTVGSALLEPTFVGLGWDLAVLPTWLILVGLVWLIPLAGQIGMNPIMAVTLIAPLIPSAQALGVSPSAIIVAITSGWALGGVTSPFTATTLLIGGFGNVSARHVGLNWNGVYFLWIATILSVWVVIFAHLSA